MEKTRSTRVIALIGPPGTGKTTLMEAMLFAAGAISRQGSVAAGSSVGDSSPEARARQGSTEINLARFEFLGDQFVTCDTPGAIGFRGDGDAALLAADLALVVIDPDPDRAVLAEPFLRKLDENHIPHAIFVNKIDQSRGSINTLLEALQPLSSATLVARQIPWREGDKIVGFIDLALERGYRYRSGARSEQTDIPDDLRARESNDRLHMLEQLADHDDALLEQLIADEIPSTASVFADLARETGDGVAVPVLFGSAQAGFGIGRLLKLLRHETPSPQVAAQRTGAMGACGYVLKISHGSAVGRLALTRVWGITLSDGAELVDNSGQATRIGGLFLVQGGSTIKTSVAEPGDVVAIAKIDTARSGTTLGIGSAAHSSHTANPPPASGYALAITTRNRQDDVRLSTALHKLSEEDTCLTWGQEGSTQEMLLHGVNEEHLQTVLARLQRRYGVAVDSHRPQVAYRESIRKRISQRGRHKKQSGGHGQFGDVTIELRPAEPGAGFTFDDRITGGAIPKQWIPAVEQGVRDAMEKGPLGFPVVDVAVTLVDGAFHSVDSSELAFRAAGRIAMGDALAAAAPYLLEPVFQVTIHAPGNATSRISSAAASHRGQVLGIMPREGWARWDQIDLLLPEAELFGLDAELRSISQGLATFIAQFDHLSELSGKPAQEVLNRSGAPNGAR